MPVFVNTTILFVQLPNEEHYLQCVHVQVLQVKHT
jgi:hypothetical protein